MDYLKMAVEDFKKAVRARLLEEYEESLDSAWVKGYRCFLNKLTEEERMKMPEEENMQAELFEAGYAELSNISIKKMWLDGYVSACSHYFVEVHGEGDFRRKQYKVCGCKEEFGKVEILGDSEEEHDEAEYWGVYEIQGDGTEEWLADFYEYSDAQMFALEKEKEETK